MPLAELLTCIDHWLEGGADQSELDAVARDRPELAEPLRRLAEVVLGQVAPGPELSKTNFPSGYRYCRELGSGGFARVVLAERIGTGREVAIKFPTAGSRLGDVNSYRRFVREARVQSLYSRSNIATLYDIDTHGGQLFLLTEYMPGETLREYLARTGPLKPNRAAALLERIADAVGYLHRSRERVIHRDLTPKNVMILTREAPAGNEHADGAIPEIKLIDFGLCKLLDPDNTQLTGPGDVLGTPAYMAPEQFVPGFPQDARTDVYAIGAILFEMLVGRPIRPLPEHWSPHKFMSPVRCRV